MCLLMIYSHVSTQWRCTVVVRGKGTKVHVYLPYQEAISFYVYIVPSGLISIFLDLNAIKFPVASIQHVFS